ncbi:hypothetical protein AMATHDRAFT_74546 [Amanita thiersii Skay4041]|uniref:Rho-GAP domain-containing protein n=1 Tax=Amanita thiersii Skay4041 TaxID=703135 RepID=A0A2A9NUV7_9AGAR|nr:hypothetical protein AMATHDRAFT_74546 [Amanita thiersii Skay4041]
MTSINQRTVATLHVGQDGDEAAWGSNFWVTLVDPQTQTSFFACPATGEVSWDPPVGHFVLPPSDEGEWWELIDESRGLPYYYHTRTGDTVWERPPGFVIPLKIIQNTTLGRRLSRSAYNRVIVTPSVEDTSGAGPSTETNGEKINQRSKLPTVDEHGRLARSQVRQTRSAHANVDTRIMKSPGATQPAIRRSISSDQNMRAISRGIRSHFNDPQLTPIPGSPYSTEHSAPPSPTSQRSLRIKNLHIEDTDKVSNQNHKLSSAESSPRLRAKTTTLIPSRSTQPQSLNAALEKLASSPSESGAESSLHSLSYSTSRTTLSSHAHGSDSHPRLSSRDKSHTLPSPSKHHGKELLSGLNGSSPTVGGKQISGPIINHAATYDMSPVKNRATGRPIPVQPQGFASPTGSAIATLSSGTYRVLPEDLASDIQQFAQSEYARQYFSTHRSGFIFRRKIPVNQLMAWQRNPLTAPLLILNRSLTREAVKVFKVIQHIMGDREREKAVNVRIQSDTHSGAMTPVNSSTASLVGLQANILEEVRWLLNEGITQGELRDEIYCQLMKQLTSNPSTESLFKGWQLLCVLLISFPPSKNFETHLRIFVHGHTSHQEGRVDIMAKHCLRRLSAICRKGPRGKPPTISEIETASDAAFNPSTFGESLDAITRLQERNYPEQKVPIILPFLANGILALGGIKAEGIFRVPGDGDSVSELKLRIDRGYYTLDGVDDPHVLASLMKLWLRELCEPLVPEELYNDCVTNSEDPTLCVQLVHSLPTINRRVVLFIISFLQLFLGPKVEKTTKMTAANLALVFAPNILRCRSESLTVVYTNSQFEQLYVFHLLQHLKCNEVDPHYIPQHGLAGIETQIPFKGFKSKSRRTN